MTVGESFLSAFLQVAFDRLASPILLYVARLWNLHNELTKLERILSKIQAVITDAEKKQMNNNAVKIWIDELKHVAYNAEDILDEFATEALKWKSREESQVLNHSFVSSLSPDVLSFKLAIETRLKRTTDMLEAIVEEKNDLGLVEGIVGNKSIGIRERLPTGSLLIESSVYGREKDLKKFRELLKSDESLICVIPIVGMGGIGKTTLAQLIYNDDEVKRIFNLRAWACVTEEFDVVRVTRAILESATKNSWDLKDLDPLQVSLEGILKKKRFLIVLDDVWTNNYSDWNVLRAPFKAGEKGSKIVVTSRSEVVSSIMGSVPSHYLEGLSEEDCYKLLMQHALDKKFEVDPKLEDIGKEIVKKCKGLPLVAKTLGSLMRFKLTCDEWEDILNSEIWDILEDRCEILSGLWLSYHHLHAHLKQCFAYCSIFPKGYQYEKEKLVMLWMAEGFVHPKGGKEMEDVGAGYFDSLVSLSFFQQSSHNKSRYIMHDLINDLAQLVSRETSFRLDARSEGDEMFKISEKTRHSSFVRGEEEKLTKFERFRKLECLRTFLPVDLEQICMGSVGHLPRQVLQDLFPKLRCLRVLCVSHYAIDELPNSIKNFKHLRYLDLSYTRIKKLPDSTSTLYNLQTLLLTSCGCLMELPEDMGNLINLRHLEISKCYNLQKMPIGIGRLTCLQKLSNFIVDETRECGIRELRNMMSLREKLCISRLENVANVRDATEANSRSKQHLNGLELKWSSYVSGRDVRDEDVLNRLKPHKNLKELVIDYYGGSRFPIWIGHWCSNLVILKFGNCKECVSLPCLGQLPSLKDLYIYGMDALKSVGHEFYGDGSVKKFPSLEALKFENMPAWDEWSGVVDEDEKQFTCLHELVILECPKLKALPNVLHSLEKLEICQCQALEAVPSQLPSLCKFVLEGCDEMILRSLVDLTSLTIFNISEISEFTCLHQDVMQHLKALEHMEISCCGRLTALSSDEIEGLQNLTSLRHLEILKCSQLKSFPQGEDGMPGRLEILHIEDCFMMEKLPYGLHRLSFLEELYISGCPSLVSFPEIGLPSMLRRLEIKTCGKLLSLPEGMRSNNTHLECLIIEKCSSFTSFPRNGLPAMLKNLEIHGCASLQSLPEGMMSNYTHLEYLGIKQCGSLTSFSGGLGPLITTNAIKLRKLEIKDCVNLDSLPHGLHNFIGLQHLDIQRCPRLASFPQGGLPSTLRSLSILSCDILHPPSNFLHNLTSIQDLHISGCPLLRPFT